MPTETLGEALRRYRQLKKSETLRDISNIIGSGMDSERLGFAGAKAANLTEPRYNEYQGVDILTGHPERLEMLKLLLGQDATRRIEEAKTKADLLASDLDAYKVAMSGVVGWAQAQSGLSQQKVQAIQAVVNNAINELTPTAEGRKEVALSPQDTVKASGAALGDISENGLGALHAIAIQYPPGSGGAYAALDAVAKAQGLDGPREVLETYGQTLANNPAADGSAGQYSTIMADLNSRLTQDLVGNTTSAADPGSIVAKQKDELTTALRGIGIGVPQHLLDTLSVFEKRIQEHSGENLDDAVTDEDKQKAKEIAEAAGLTLIDGKSHFDNPAEAAGLLQEIVNDTTYSPDTARSFRESIQANPEYQEMLVANGLDKYPDQNKVFHILVKEAAKQGHLGSRESALGTRALIAATSGADNKAVRLDKAADKAKVKREPIDDLLSANVGTDNNLRDIQDLIDAPSGDTTVAANTGRDSVYRNKDNKREGTPAVDKKQKLLDAVDTALAGVQQGQQQAGPGSTDGAIQIEVAQVTPRELSASRKQHLRRMLG